MWLLMKWVRTQKWKPVSTSTFPLFLTHLRKDSIMTVRRRKKFNLFVKPGKDNVVQAIKPGLDNEKSKRGSAKKQQSLPKKQVKEKKAPQNKKGQKKDNETISPVKSKRKTKVPAKFLDGIDFSKDVNTISLSVVFPFTVRPFLVSV